MKPGTVPADVFIQAGSVQVADGHVTATCPYCLHHVEAEWTSRGRKRLRLLAHQDDCLHHVEKLCPASRQHFPVSGEA